MPKLCKGRFTGKAHGDVGPRGLPEPAWMEIPKLSIADLHTIAERYESELARKLPDDHPAWLRSRATRVRTLIRQKERALEHRRRQHDHR